MPRSRVDFWVEYQLAKYPASEGIAVYRWAKRPLADAGAFKEGRLISVSKIRRSCSDPDGNYFVGQVTVVLEDQDSVLRTLANAGTPTEYMTGREMSVLSLTPAGRAAELEPYTRFRGFVTDVQPLPGRKFRIEISDPAGSQFSGFNLDKLWPALTVRDLNPNAPDSSRDLVLSIIGGEHSDLGAVDQNGESAEKGLVPVRDVGEYSVMGIEPSAPPGQTSQPRMTNVDGGGSFDQFMGAFVAAVNSDGVIGALAQSTVGLGLTPTRGVYVHWNVLPDMTSIDHWIVWVFDGNFHPFFRPTEGRHVYKEHDLTEDGIVLGPGSYPDADYSMLFTGFDDGFQWTGIDPQYATPPQNLTATVVGTAGTTTRSYAVTGVTRYGQTRFSNVVTVTNSSDLLTDQDYVQLSWDRPASGADAITAYRVWGRTANPPTAWLSLLTNGGTYIDPETTYADQGVDGEHVGSLPAVNTAVASENAYHFMLVSLGYSYELLDIFASDLAEATAPKRMKLPQSSYGDEVVTPDDANWPHPDPWVEINGIRVFGFYMRGPRLQHHIDNVVTVAVNVCGPHDADGKAITQAFRLYAWFFNEHIFKNNGSGYRTGDFFTLETFANGDPLLKTSAWEDAQDLSVQFMGGVAASPQTADGYLANMAITDPTSLREIIRRMCVSHAFRMAANHHGQLMPVLINDLANPTLGRHLRERIEIKQFDQRLGNDEVRNREHFRYHWDADGQAFRASDIFEHMESIAAHAPGGVIGSSDIRGLRERDERLMYYCNDEATATDVVNRELLRRHRRPRYLMPTVDLMGLDFDLGDQHRITHTEGLGPNGDLATPTVILALEDNPDTDEITFEEMDLFEISTMTPEQVTSEGSGLFGPDGSPIIGDETSSPWPPIGDETTTTELLG